MSIKAVFLSAQTLEEFRGRARQSARKVNAHRKAVLSLSLEAD